MAAIIRTEVKDDSWSTFLRAEVRLDDGAQVWRQIEDHGAAAAVLPYDADRRCVLLVKLFRAPALYAGCTERLVEPVAGMIDAVETAEDCARREALEEAGVRLGALERVAQVWSSPGISTERITLFLAPYAAEDRVAPGGGLPAEHEDIEVLELGLVDVVGGVADGRFDDMKLLGLVQALQLRRPQLFT